MITQEITAPGREVCRLAAVPVQTPYIDTRAGLLIWEAAAHEAAEHELCDHCGLDGHYVTVRVTPRPDPARPDAIDELVEACSCCVFGEIGHPERGLLARLRGEQAEGDDHDLTIEVLTPEGRWF